MPRYFACLFAFLVTIVLTTGATASDVKVMISAGFFNVYADLGPAFEKLYRARFFGHKFDLSGVLHVDFLPGETRLARAA